MRQSVHTVLTTFLVSAALLNLAQPGHSQSWRMLTPPAAPPVRNSSAMVTDSALGRTILFGGYDASYLSDTWSFDGVHWTQLPGGPVQRGQHAMAFDASRGVAVMFGGVNSVAVSGYLADTWEFANGAWSQRPTGINRPAPRFGHGMAYDRMRQRVVLFGGRTNAGTIFLDDTWEWDGTAWAYYTPPSAPSRRMDHAMATDPLSGQVLLFGGLPIGGPVNGETWTWNGLTWTMLAPAHAPSPRMQAVAALDDRRARLVLFGGYDGGDLADTWQWNGSDWQSVTTPVQPGALALPSFATGPTGGVVLFGGQVNGSNQNATWAFDRFAAATAYGTGCGNPALALAASGGQSPVLGTLFQSAFGPLAATAVPFQSIGLSNTSAGGLTLPLSLAPWQMPGCWLLQDAVAPFLPCTITSGMAVHSLALPAAPVFAGLRMFLQGFVLDPGVNAAGIATSNGLELELGF